MTHHPSGRPIRAQRRGVQSIARPTQTFGLIERLNPPAQLVELAGGMGFHMPRSMEDFSGTWAKGQRPN